MAGRPGADRTAARRPRRAVRAARRGRQADPAAAHPGRDRCARRHHERVGEPGAPRDGRRRRDPRRPRAAATSCGRGSGSVGDDGLTGRPGLTPRVAACLASAMGDDYGPSTYGDRIADVYDDIYGHAPAFGDISRPVAFLASLAGGGPALELGIGTGRIALPLQAAGVRVHGIDASTAMVERLRAKPGGNDIPVTIGDFGDFSLDERFPLIYVPFNTFFALLTQDDQVACFRAVARHLTPGRRVRDRGVRPGSRPVRPGSARLGHPCRPRLRIARGLDERSREQVTDSHHVVIRTARSISTRSRSVSRSSRSWT